MSEYRYRDYDDEQDSEQIARKRQRAGKKEKARKRRIRRLWCILGVEVLILVVLLAMNSVRYVDEKFDEIDYTPLNEEDLSINEGLSPEIREKYMTVALFGIDARDVNHDDGNRCDTIIIASLNKDTNEVKIMSVLRDTYVEFENPGGNYDGCYTKVTHSYAFGGAKGAVATLNQNLDLQITDYATVNFLSLADIVDDLGGITLDVTEDERNSVNFWLPETATIAGRSYVELYETGEAVTLDGLQAVTYCRIRNIGNGDIDRAGRQREVIYSILSKAKSSDMATLNKILDDVLPEVSTSLSKKEILSLMTGVFEYQISDSNAFPFVYHVDPEGYYDDIAQMKLSIVAAADLQYNVELAHQFLYDAVIDETGSAVGTDSNEVYSPSLTVQGISETITERTGLYRPEDPELRGGF